jgi:hypothetical protein
MKKCFLLVSLLVFYGSVALFADTFSLSDNWTLTEYSNGSYSIDDNDRGVCYYITIETSSRGDSFIVRVENWVERNLTKTAIKQAIQAGLRSVGAGGIAGPAASIIVNIFEPSAAH